MDRDRVRVRIRVRERVKVRVRMRIRMNGHFRHLKASRVLSSIVLEMAQCA